VASSIGFLPCFSDYKHKEFPITPLYENTSYVDKVKRLLSSLVDLENPMYLSSKCGVGKEIQPIRPDSKEGKRLINLFATPYQLYRIDYGNNPFRIIFAISNTDRMAFVLAFDLKHNTFKK